MLAQDGIQIEPEDGDGYSQVLLLCAAKYGLTGMVELLESGVAWRSAVSGEGSDIARRAGHYGYLGRHP